MIDLGELLDRGEAHVRNMLLRDRAKSLTPIFHLVALDPSRDRVISVMWRNEIEKQLVLLEIKAAARDIDAVAVLVMTEAWTVSIKAAPTPWHAQRALDAVGPPSESPDRIEVVSIAVSDGENSRMRLLQMVRDKPGGRLVALVPHSDSGGGRNESVQGRIFDVLPRRRK